MLLHHGQNKERKTLHGSQLTFVMQGDLTTCTLEKLSHINFHQGGYVLVAFVCLSVRNITKKVKNVLP